MEAHWRPFRATWPHWRPPRPDAPWSAPPATRCRVKALHRGAGSCRWVISFLALADKLSPQQSDPCRPRHRPINFDHFINLGIPADPVIQSKREAAALPKVRPATRRACALGCALFSISQRVISSTSRSAYRSGGGPRELICGCFIERPRRQPQDHVAVALARAAQEAQPVDHNNQTWRCPLASTLGSYVTDPAAAWRRWRRTRLWETARLRPVRSPQARWRRRTRPA